jgi:hypothetical protein
MVRYIHYESHSTHFTIYWTILPLFTTSLLRVKQSILQYMNNSFLFIEEFQGLLHLPQRINGVLLEKSRISLVTFGMGYAYCIVKSVLVRFGNFSFPFILIFPFLSLVSIAHGMHVTQLTACRISWSILSEFVTRTGLAKAAVNCTAVIKLWFLQIKIHL